MSDPNEFQLNVVGEAARIRGSIITSYAQVEFLLADMVMRCSQRPEYAALDLKFPYTLEKRIAKVREIVRHPGTFARYASEVETLVDGLLRFEETRHMMAHGCVTVRTTPTGKHDLTYRLWRSGKKNVAEYGEMVTNIPSLWKAFFEVGQYASDFVLLWRRMYLENDLKPAI